MRSRLLIVCFVAAAFACTALAPVASAAPQGCTIKGTDHDDVLKGTPAPDIICGYAGNDVLVGGDGDDKLFGGPGTDTASYEFASSGVQVNLRLRTATGPGTDVLDQIENVIGSAKADTIEGSPKSNLLVGGEGDDEITGLGGDDRIEGEGGNDHLEGNLGNDHLSGGYGNDVLEGGYDRDRLFGDEGDDKLNAGDGPDLLVGGPDKDALVGGTGTDGCAPGAVIGYKQGCESIAYAGAEGLPLFPPTHSIVGYAYHESLFGSAIDLLPYGHLVQNDSDRFTAPPESEGPGYYVMNTRHRAPGPTTATDIVVGSNTTVYAPVDGTVVNVTQYRLYCKTVDWKVTIQPTEEPTDRVLVLHMARPSVEEGDHITALLTEIGVSQQNDMVDAQENKYFPDGYPHVHIEVETDGADPIPGCSL